MVVDTTNASCKRQCRLASLPRPHHGAPRSVAIAVEDVITVIGITGSVGDRTVSCPCMFTAGSVLCRFHDEDGARLSRAAVAEAIGT